MSHLSSTTILESGWKFTQLGGGPANKDGVWLPASKSPTSVHVELLKLNKIPNPFLGLSEHDIQWIGEGDWTFKNTFEIDPQVLQLDNVDVVFEGLDTYAVVELNGQKILDANNMFIEYRVHVKPYLEAGSNTLVITFPSTFLKGRELQTNNGTLACWNGDSSRLHVRKAQYHYGWDWGPITMTMGPWKPVYIHAYKSRLLGMRVTSTVTDSYGVDVEVKASASHSEASSAAIRFRKDKLVLTTRKILMDKDNTINLRWSTSPKELELWWPVGMGEQNLHTIDVELLDKNGNILDAQSKRVGFRRVEVVQNPVKEQEGRSFYFKINDVPVFCGGSNWIPLDSFLTEATKERYQQWLQLLLDGNQNMVRVWGGGIYESDAFYDICDELGIMIWQDFLFGCGQYPAYDEILERIIPEAEQAVTRLRHHPALVIFAGNNEDYALAESLNLELDYSDETSDFRKTSFPGRHIYERVLPDVVSRLSDVHYHRASPYSGFGKKSSDVNYGDLHQWNVWHGSQEPWHNWDKLAGRFVSEFGMQGYPDRRTVDYWTAGNEAERYPQSRMTDSHNKAAGFERRLELYLVENFKHTFDMDSYIYYTQIMQAETLASAYRLWRRNWKGPGREYTAGALVWQMNDCWPVTSWAIVDYFRRPKPAYFSIARELRPYTVGMTRRDVKTPTKPNSAAFFEIDTSVEIWGTNSTTFPKEATLVIEAFDLHDKSFQWNIKRTVTLGPNRSSELWKGRVPGQKIRTTLSDVPRTIILSARLINAYGDVLARYANWPEPFKFITFPPIQELGFKIITLPIEATEVEEELKRIRPFSRSPPDMEDVMKIILSTSLPMKGIVLDAEGSEDVKWSDQAIDLVPGDDQVVLAWGLKGRVPTACYLGDGSA